MTLFLVLLTISRRRYRIVLARRVVGFAIGVVGSRPASDLIDLDPSTTFTDAGDRELTLWRIPHHYRMHPDQR